jgi:hypothetical protein
MFNEQQLTKTSVVKLPLKRPQGVTVLPAENKNGGRL